MYNRHALDDVAVDTECVTVFHSRQDDVFQNNEEYSAMPVQDSDDETPHVLEKADVGASTDSTFQAPAGVLKSGHAELNFSDRLPSNCGAVCGVDEMGATEATELDPRQSEVGLDKGGSIKVREIIYEDKQTIFGGFPATSFTNSI